MRCAAIAITAALLALPGCGSTGEPEADRDPRPPRSDGRDRDGRDSRDRDGRDSRRPKRPPARNPAKPEPLEPGEHADVVLSVTDGDTVQLRRLGKARLIGVDTPEVYGGAECFGREASEFAKRRLPPGLRVTYDWGVERRDRYGRALIYLYVGQTMFNAELVRRGFAQPLTIPPNVDFAERFVALARQARRRARGLWAEEACADEAGGGGASGGGSATKYCSDFATRRQAQRYHERHGGNTSLDGDGDGQACETLP